MVGAAIMNRFLFWDFHHQLFTESLNFFAIIIPVSNKTENVHENQRSIAI